MKISPKMKISVLKALGVGMGFCILLVNYGCKLTGEESTTGTIDDVDRFYEWLHSSQIEPIYDGAGTWGVTQNGYRVVLRDISWKADAYGRMGLTTHANAPLYALRAAAAIQSLMRIQDEGGNGCWGIPDEPDLPEFGARIQQVEALQAADPSQHYIVNGWIVDLPQANLPELYFDHGRVLTALCHHYQRTGSTALEVYIQRGADWCLNKPGTSNVNYNASLIEGLAHAYAVLGTASYRDKAISLLTNYLLPARNGNGSYGDAHNQKLRYHGFNISALAALRHVLAEGDSLLAPIADHLVTARSYMADGLRDANPDFDIDAIGISIRVYAEIADLAAEGKTTELSALESERLSFLYGKCIEAETSIPALGSAYTRQKAQWHYVQCGVAVAKFKYGR
jgi:hypothetical protein